MRIKVRRAVWNVVCALFFRPFGTPYLWWWRRCVLSLFGAKVHRKAMVYSSVRIWAPWQLRMERGSCLGPRVECYNQALVYLQEGATVSQRVTLCTAGHTTDEPNNAHSGLLVAPITLHKDCWIGMQAFIGMGVEVGERAVVGATASVFKDVEPATIIGGNPAKIIGTSK